MDTCETLRTMRSVREFNTPREVPDEIITRILNAGRLSGSSKNTQPWEFILIRDRQRLEALAACGDFARHLTYAHFAIAILTQTTKRADYDAGRCSQNMMLAAWNDGVGSCIATMHRQQDAKQLLQVPDDWTIQVVISFGYPGAKVLDRTNTPRKGGRKTLDEIVSYEHWGKRS